MSEMRATHPIMLGVVGDSAAGKTTLTAGIAALLGSDRVTVIGTDDYHSHSRAQRRSMGLSALDPRANYMDILEQQLQRVRTGKPILKPIYNHDGGTLDAPVYVKPRPYIICEGLLGFHTRAMRDCFDVKIYLEPEESVRVEWKIERDTAHRGYTEAEVRAALDARAPDVEAFIRPQRAYADIVVRFQRQHGASRARDLDARLTLRPTLPHPDLSPTSGTANGLHVELARDADGKPVDMLHIDDANCERSAAGIEDRLWSLMPAASHLRSVNGSGAPASPIDSSALALTQLFVAYHMVMAAQGIHAI